LIGRDGELRMIREALGAGASGVVIGGAAGVGKTRIAREVLDDRATAGAFIARARATRSSVGIPLAAFGAYVPAGAQPTSDAGNIHDVIAALRAQAGDRELIVGVDDAQLLDPASATLLLHLAEHAIASVVATVRGGEPCPDAVTELWKDAGCMLLELEPLGDAQLAELVETVLGGPLQHDARRWMIEQSHGNVLYARQLVEHAIESDALVSQDGLWRLARRPSTSYSLRELIAARMGELSGRERSALELLTLSEPLPLTEASTLIDGETLATLESKRLVTVVHDDGQPAQARIAEPLYAELIAAQMPASRGREHRVELAELVSTREHLSAGDRVRVALWLTDAGGPVAMETLLEAARAANAAGIDSGGHFAQQALDAGAGAEASMLLALGHVMHNRPDEAERVLADVEGTIEDRRLAGEYLRERAIVLQWSCGRTEETIALLDRAVAWWPDEPWRAQVAILRLPFMAIRDPPGAHAAELEQLIGSAALPEEARRWLRRALAGDLLSSGRTEAAEAMLPEIPGIPFGELEFLEFAWISIIGLASGAALPLLEQKMRDTFYRAAAVPDPAAAALAAVTVAATSYLAGRFLDCRRWAAEAISESERQDPLAARIIARALQVGLSLALGDQRAASAAGHQLDAEVTSVHLAQPSIAAWIARGRAWGLLAAARPPEAQALLLQAADGQGPVFGAELRYEAMRAGRPARELAPALQELAGRSDSPLTAAYAQHANARAAGDAQALLEAAEAFAAIAVNHYASEAAAHASAAFAADGRQDSARRAAARSRELQPAEQGAQPVSIEGVDRDAIELTPREAQMVELAARGLTNGEIAETLVLSTRTVETHIYRAMRKLGVSDRRDFRPVPANRG
jgi:DNA-binding NarL/FixJ family response regulator